MEGKKRRRDENGQVREVERSKDLRSRGCVHFGHLLEAAFLSSYIPVFTRLEYWYPYIKETAIQFCFEARRRAEEGRSALLSCFPVSLSLFCLLTPRLNLQGSRWDDFVWVFPTGCSFFTLRLSVWLKVQARFHLIDLIFFLNLADQNELMDWMDQMD